MAKSRKKSKPGPSPMAAEDLRVQIPVRVKPKIRKQLGELKRHIGRHSLSRIVELLLEKKLIDVEWRGDHHMWFGLLVGRVAWEVEQRMRLNPPQFATSKGWLENAFAARYVKATVVGLLEQLERFIPPGPTSKIPDHLRRTAKQLPPSLSPEQVEYFNSAGGLGNELARDLWHQLYTDRSPFSSDEFLEDVNEMPKVQDADLMPKIARGLGLKK